MQALVVAEALVPHLTSLTAAQRGRAINSHSRSYVNRMSQAAVSAKTINPSRDEFAALLAESLAKDDLFEGSVVKGKIVGIEKDLAVIDVGLKMEGRVPLQGVRHRRQAGRPQGRRRGRGLPGARRECAR